MFRCLRARRLFSECSQFAGALSKDVEVANGEEDHVGEAFETPESGSAILDNLDDPIDAFANCIGQRSLDECDDIVEMFAQRRDKGSQRGYAASECIRRPSFEESLGGGLRAEVPEVLELVFEYPGAVNATVGLTQPIQEAGMGLGAVSGVQGQ